MVTHHDDTSPRKHPVGWRAMLPVLKNESVVLREVQVGDTAVLLKRLSRPAVSQFSDPPPSTVEAFEQYVRWAHRNRDLGRHASFAIIPPHVGEPVGLLQFWLTGDSPGVLEWGGALDDRFWGVGLFASSARLLIDFVFHEAGADRLEANVCVGNEAAHATMRKLGAKRESVLSPRFKVHGEYRDHVQWSILRGEWCQARTPHGLRRGRCMSGVETLTQE